jgi:oxygen-independent coproporphyrinogen III oxidase
VSAISGFDAAYAQSYREVPAYSDAVVRRGIGTMRGYRMTEDDRLRRAVISRLLCHTVIDKREIGREFGISFDEYFAPELRQLEEFRGDGLVETSATEIRVTPLGRVFIRNLGMIFDRYLREQQMDARPLFSKTL